MKTDFVPIPGFEGLYEINRLGQVRSIDRVVVDSIGRSRPFPAKEIKASVNDKGYLDLTLSKQGKNYNRAVHVLLALTFIGPRPDGMEVCHDDGDSLNNALENLRYDTSASNTRDMILHGRHHLMERESCPLDHLLIDPNLVAYKKKKGIRSCKSCQRAMTYANNRKSRYGEIIPREEFESRAHSAYQKIMSGEYNKGD